MHESRAKFIYNIFVSLFMGYLLVNSVSMFNRYFLHYRENLFARLNIQVASSSPITPGELTKVIADSLIKITPDLQPHSYSLDIWDKSYTKLSERQEVIIGQLKQAGLSIVSFKITPPIKSQRLLRLELTAAIPAFLIAVFWFYHLNRWIIYAIKGSKNFLEHFQERVKNELSRYDTLQGKWELTNKDGVCEISISKQSENGFPVKLSLSASNMEVITHEIHNHQSFSHDIDKDKFIDDTIEMLLNLLSPLRRIKEIMIAGKPVKWYLEEVDYKLTEKLLNKIRHRVNPEIFIKLEGIKNQSFKNKEAFITQIATLTGLKSEDESIKMAIKAIETEPEWRILDKTHLLFYNYFHKVRTEKVYQNQMVKFV